jgi:hypothetical protein
MKLAPVKRKGIFTSSIAVILLIVMLSFFSFSCGTSPSLIVSSSAKTSLTTPVSSPTLKTTQVTSSGALNAITKSGNGIPVTDKNVLLGSWAEIKVDNFVGGLTQTRTYSTNGSDSYIFTFDQINVTETHGGSTIYTGDWDYKNGTFTMKDNSPNSRPIVYTDLRFKDGILTAIYQDGDLSQILTWQKMSD